MRPVLLVMLACTILAGGAPAAEPGHYDPASMETVAGEVVRVDAVPVPGRSSGLELVLRTEAGDEVPVALGPRWVCERHGFLLRPGDRVTITGVRVVRGKPALLAARVRKGDATLVLRDHFGVPVWSRGHDG